MVEYQIVGLHTSALIQNGRTNSGFQSGWCRLKFPEDKLILKTTVLRCFRRIPVVILFLKGRDEAGEQLSGLALVALALVGLALAGPVLTAPVMVVPELGA
jgi:hypothetical protein